MRRLFGFSVCVCVCVMWAKERRGLALATSWQTFKGIGERRHQPRNTAEPHTAHLL